MSLLAINVDGGQTDAGLSLAPFGALFPGSSVMTSGSLLVSAQVSPDMTVKVRGSDDDDAAIIKTSSGATYYVKNTDPNESVTILANSSGVTKTDVIVGYVDLTAGDPDNAGSPGAFKIVAVRRSGTNTGTPTDGEIDAATNNNEWDKYAEISVTNGATEITDADITDLRTRAKIWLPAGDETVTPAARVGGFKIGTISSATLSTTGNKAITGVGFKPKYVEFRVMYHGSSSYGFDGAMDEFGNQFARSLTARMVAADNVYGNSDFVTDSCFKYMGTGTTGTMTNPLKAEYVSMDEDGFTINVSAATGANSVLYIAHG